MTAKNMIENRSVPNLCTSGGVGEDWKSAKAFLLRLGHIITQAGRALKGTRSAFMVNRRFATVERWDGPCFTSSSRCVG